MSNLSHTIRKFNRFELKYLIPRKVAQQIKKDLLAYLVPDAHGNGAGKYLVTSLYYDSPAFRFYWEKMDGIKFRRKLRLRHYGANTSLAAETPVFVEIKQRADRVTQKRRALLPYAAALNLCNQRQQPETLAGDQTVMNEVSAMLWQYDLHPASLIQYTRQALIGSDYDIGLRVTFDTNLRYHPTNLDLRKEQSGILLFPPDFAVMEIKVNERIPYWLTELVADHNLHLTRLSKYCRSIELAQNFPATAWQIR